MKEKLCLVLLLLAATCPMRVHAADNPAATFLKANESYNQGNYASAEALYRKILDAGIKNGKVYYNLGNALFRQGKTGEAIQNYLIARQFIPRDEDLEANLRYARQKVSDRTETSSPSGSVGNIFFRDPGLSVKELVVIFLACNLLFWSGLGARLFSPRPATTWLVAASLVCGLAMGTTAAVRVIDERQSPPAVIITSEAQARSGMDPESDTLFVLHDGAEVNVEKESGDWSLIRSSSGKKGWVRKEQLGIASP
jgi:Bacterial SH3 domain